MPQTITLSGDYQYEPWKAEGLTNAIINASNAEWIVANIGSDINFYPVSVRDSGTIILAGGQSSGKCR